MKKLNQTYNFNKKTSPRGKLCNFMLLIFFISYACLGIGDDNVDNSGKNKPPLSPAQKADLIIKDVKLICTDGEYNDYSIYKIEDSRGEKGVIPNNKVIEIKKSENIVLQFELDSETGKQFDIVTDHADSQFENFEEVELKYNTRVKSIYKNSTYNNFIPVGLRKTIQITLKTKSNALDDSKPLPNFFKIYERNGDELGRIIFYTKGKN